MFPAFISEGRFTSHVEAQLPHGAHYTGTAPIAMATAPWPTPTAEEARAAGPSFLLCPLVSFRRTCTGGHWYVAGMVHFQGQFDWTEGLQEPSKE